MTTTSLAFHDFHHLSDAQCLERIRQAKDALGDKLFILGHYYQRDEVYQFADVTGDSLQLSMAAAETKAPYIVFCGVHFMAEVADILTQSHQAVMLPDLKAGCSMADMANLASVERCWADLQKVCNPDNVVMPITYVNSAANLKAFCADHGGTICTSSNAKEVLDWALSERKKVLFFPDQHLGRNTAHAMGIGLDKMAVWNFRKPMGGLTPEEIDEATILLWDGWCSVHQRFETDQIDQVLAQHPDTQIIAHPESSFEVCQRAHHMGSTSFIRKKIADSAPGTRWLVATEYNLVNRLHHEFAHEGKVVSFMAPTVSMCSTMFRIDPQHLAWVLDNLQKGNVVNRIQVPENVAQGARVALDRMFTLTQQAAKQ